MFEQLYKAFNGKDISPLETIQIARAEAESWRTAQIIEQPQEGTDGEAPRPSTSKPWS
ncbi:unnamed protein product [Brassica oleracea]